jgi:N-acetylmuramoyl-L-alanine amidase
VNRRAWPWMLLLPWLMAVNRPSGLGDVADVRYWSYPEYTRVVVELDRAVRTEVKELPPDPGHRRPARLYLDLPEVWVGRDYPDAIPVADGLLRGIRLGQNQLRTARLVIDLDRYERYRLLLLGSPPRVVVDVYGRRGPSQPPSDAGGPRLPVGMRPIRRVVLDPGHGGRDPGAIASSGLREKDVTLRLARFVRRELERRSFEVFLTRDGDETLELEERTAFAEGMGGDLFVSLHANAAPRRSLRGVETYYLDRNHSRHTIRVAAHENGIAPSELDSLQRTMASLRMGELSFHSAQLAQAVQTQIVSGMRGEHGGVADLGVKKGPFFVLFLAHSPSILVEVGFLSNRDESRRLAQAGYLESLGVHIAEGVARYRDGLAPVVAEGRR